MTRRLYDACRIRSNACCWSIPALCPEPGLLDRIPFDSPLPSTPSAGRSAPRPLFGSFPGTIGLSDFPRSFIAVVLPWDSQHGPQGHLLRPNVGPPGSRMRSFCTCSGSLTTQGLATSRDSDVANIAFRFCGQRRHPKVYNIFRGSIALPALPLPTLRLYPYEDKRMTRGRCGSLSLHRMELSSTTPRRFLPAHPK